MKPNVIILTGGLSGSSVLANLISKEGYWLGDSTKDVNYKTYENSKLVDLNIEILDASGFRWRDVIDIPPPSIENIENMVPVAGENKYKNFVRHCEKNSPWLWKDPRLCYTSFFWRRYIDVNNCKFILMSRDIRQTWAGIILRGKMPISYSDLETVERNCIDHAKKFLNRENIEYLSMTFEDLITKPEDSLSRLNHFLHLHLDMDHLQAVYKGPLRRLRWSEADFFKARLKFAYYTHVKRDPIYFPRREAGKGSGWRHVRGHAA